MKRKVLIKGAGEQATATAHRLFRCGFHVAMTEIAKPTAVRRLVSFTTAVFDGETAVEGVRASLRDLCEAPALESFDWRHVPVFVDPACRLREIWRPEIIVDARIAKRNIDNRCGDAPLVIGFGPGLEAGRDVDCVIETNRGHNLGRILFRGMADPNTGVPGEIAGESAKRVLRSPCGGIFEAEVEIGAVVSAGDTIGRIGREALIASISGALRGLIHTGLEVRPGQKLGDIDPRGEPAFCRTISDKARNLSGSALEIAVAFASGTLGKYGASPSGGCA